MQLSQESFQYFSSCINSLCKKSTCKITAKQEINLASGNDDALVRLNGLFKKDFIAACSAIGMNAPVELINYSSSDIAKIQLAVGTTSQASNPSANNNLMNSVSDLTTQINILCKLISADKFYSDNSLSYIISGTPNILTSCKRVNGNFVLDEVIARPDLSILGILKAHKDCANWTLKKIDHYFTKTENVDDCSSLLPIEIVNAECIIALGVTIENITD